MKKALILLILITLSPLLSHAQSTTSLPDFIDIKKYSRSEIRQMLLSLPLDDIASYHGLESQRFRRMGNTFVYIGIGLTGLGVAGIAYGANNSGSFVNSTQRSVMIGSGIASALMGIFMANLGDGFLTKSKRELKKGVEIYNNRNVEVLH